MKEEGRGGEGREERGGGRGGCTSFVGSMRFYNDDFLLLYAGPHSSHLRDSGISIRPVPQPLEDTLTCHLWTSLFNILYEEKKQSTPLGTV